jgi:putative ABC transport system substrate-binding protein
MKQRIRLQSSTSRSENLKSKIQNRKWLGLSVTAFVLVVCGAVAEAQQPKKVHRIGVLAQFPAPQHDALLQGLRDLGYSDGDNIVIERRYAKGDRERIPELAAELASLKVDVIVSIGPVTPFAAKSIKNIPVVMAISGDPVDAGIVASLARPGGNVTGMTFFAAVLAGKRVELLKETVPKISRVAVVANPGHAGEQLELKETQATARALNVALQYLTVRTPQDFNDAFLAMTKERAEGIIAFPDALLLAHRKDVAEFAAKSRIPLISGWSEFVEAGGLMTYGPNLFDSLGRVALFVDKILKGAKPADLPVEQPTKFELVINLKTAKQIGLTIPASVLARADRVIK